MALSNGSQTVYLCSETPGKSGELGRLAGGRRVDAGKGEGKAVDEAEVKAGVVAEAWTTLATREEEMVVLIPEAVEGEGVGAIGVEVDPVEGGVWRVGEEEAVVEAGAVAEVMGTTTTTAMAAEVVEGEDVGAVGVEVEDGLRVTAVGEGGEVGGVQEEAVEGEVVAVLTLL